MVLGPTRTLKVDPPIKVRFSFDPPPLPFNCGTGEGFFTSGGARTNFTDAEVLDFDNPKAGVTPVIIQV